MEKEKCCNHCKKEMESGMYLLDGCECHKGQDGTLQDLQNSKLIREYLKGERNGYLKAIKDVREGMPQARSKLENVLNGRNDEIFEKHGMDGVMVFNNFRQQVLDKLTELEKNIKD